MEYRAARADFLVRANALKADLISINLNGQCGVDGEPLFIDAARTGSAQAERVLIILSGTHGPEGIAGSALQRALLSRTFERQGPDNVAIVLIHAVNPFGWAHRSRCNEDFVDLNRNFIDFSQQRPAELLDTEVYNTYNNHPVDARGLRDSWSALSTLMQKYGQSRVLSALSSQYCFPDGIHFGGTRPSSSSRAVRELIARLTEGARFAGVIDWHTGIGAYGRPFFLCFQDPETFGFREATRWWGDYVSAPGDGFGGAERPSYEGLLVSALVDQLSAMGCDSAAAVIEFGTHSNRHMFEALLKDRWIRTGRARDAEADRLKADLVAAFCPDDPDWRVAVMSAGAEIMEDALRGLSTTRLAAHARGTRV